MTLAEINRLEPAAFVKLLAAVYEHSPWVAERACRERPFRSLDELHRAMTRAVDRALREEQLALVRAHPELAGREAGAGGLTPASSGEQGRLGFTSLSPEEFQAMQNLNRRYRDKFGFPCIVALRLHETRRSVMEEMERRIDHTREAELTAALEQIGHIARGRLEKIVDG